MYNVQCTSFIMYNVQCTVYTVYCTVYNVHCIQYISANSPTILSMSKFNDILYYTVDTDTLYVICSR